MKKIILLSALYLTSTAVLAQSEEATSRYCNGIYRKICRGIKPGPELVGQCFIRYPNIMEKLPSKCTSDFQTAVEGYNEAKGRK